MEQDEKELLEKLVTECNSFKSVLTGKDKPSSYF